MDMENTRRPFDRSKEPGLKKPRLAEETQRVPNPNSNGRPFAQRPAGNNPVQSRLRVSDRDSDNNDSLRGGYHPQPPHHELVSQYKTALAELTFNSKPIITNLTIIAGENLPVAKAIAATICANIIEVPSEQKLPSLYLLDSIVKNIGRDYIKYFATKLPEVFCKAYRQVDPAVHPSMRHLFGTWKGVFPPQSLQMIEKELGFATAVNGSSTGSTNSKPDSQTHCPPHSIHVNPKYLERQRLQQPSRTKGMATDISGPAVNSLEDSERLDKATSVGRPWVDPSVKMHNMRSHRDTISERIHEKNIRSESNDYNYISDIPKSPGSEIVKTGRRVMEQGYNKPWYGGGSSVAEPITSQRNGLNIKQGFQNHSALKSTNADPNLRTAPNIANKSSGVMSSSWKNSDEEEFMWDDMNSRLTDHSASDVSSSLKKHHWTTDDSDKLGFEDFEKPPIVHDYSSNKDLAALGNQVSPPWSLQKSNSMDVSNQSRTPVVRDHPAISRSSTVGNSSLARMGGRPPMVASSHVGGSSFGFPTNTTTGSVEAPVQRRLQSLGAGSSSELLLMSQHSPLPRSTLNHPHHQFQSLTEQDPSESKSFDYADSKASHFSGKLRKETQNPYSQESPVVPPSNVQLHSMEKSQLQGIKASSPSVPAFQSRHHYTSAHQEDSPLSDPFDEIPKSPLPHISDIGTFSTSNSSPNCTNPLAAEISRESKTSSLLAAVMKSGILNSNSISSSLPNLNFQETKKLSSQTGYIPLSNGPSSSSCYDSSAVPEITQNKVGQPAALTSLSLSVGASGDASDVVNNGPHPISNLLSSLVAKGLICASKTQLPTVLPTQVPKESKRESPEITIMGTVPNTADPFVSSIILSTKNDAISSEPPAAKTPVIMPPSSKLKTKNVIGFEFKSDLLRKFHPSVIEDLLNDSPHLCSKCGLKFKFQEQFNRHLEWHSIKKSEAIEVSRRWYVDSTDWISGKAGLPLGFESAKSVEKPGQTEEKGELMVPADEIQCACVLCGEIFEDFYCQERDEWMFKGAVYMTIPSGAGDKGSTSEGVVKGPIVHANCISESSLLDLGLVACIKMEEDA